MAIKTPKSRSLRRVKITTPGGKRTIHYRKGKPSKAVCGSCGKELAGVPRERPFRIKRLSKTQRRPERPYGGVLCSACTRKTLKEKARK